MAEPRIATLQNQPLSNYITRGTLILAACILGIVLLANVFERFLLKAIHGKIWTDLERPENERRRRSFTYFHVGACIQFGLLAIGAYPAFDFLVGRSDLSAPYIRGYDHSMTIGDMLFVVCQIHNGYYLFELCFRTQFASPISIAHHIGLLIITQTSVALFGNYQKQPEGVLDFYMCMVWGAFDLVVELPIYTSMILWRVKSDKPQFLCRLMYFCSAWAVIGATTETAVTIYLMNASWDRWPIAWQIIIPMVFALWIVTQFYGAYRIRGMALSQKARLGRPEPAYAESEAEKGPVSPTVESCRSE